MADAAALLLYDGGCGLCRRWVGFLARRDPGGLIRCLPMTEARGLAASLGIDADAPATMALLLEGQALGHSDAVLAALALLPGWAWAGALRRLPRGPRDAASRLVARHRYRLFGRAGCAVPPRATPP